MPMRANRVHSEVALTFWASFLNVCGLLLLLGSIGAWVLSSFALTLVLSYGVGCGISALVTSALLRAVAEIVRVLKRNAGLPYVGSFGDDAAVVRAE